MSEERKISIEVLTTSTAWSRVLGPRVIGVNVEAVGTAKVYTSWNDKPVAGKGTVMPGVSKPFGLGFPYFLSGLKLSLDFDEVGTKQAEVTIFTDAGPLDCK